VVGLGDEAERRESRIVCTCVVCQGALIGCITSSLFSLFVAVGTFVVRPHRETLPTSIEHCNISSSLSLNETVRGLLTTLSTTCLPLNETGSDLSTSDLSLVSSTPRYEDTAMWTTSKFSSASYVQQLWVEISLMILLLVLLLVILSGHLASLPLVFVMCRLL